MTKLDLYEDWISKMTNTGIEMSEIPGTVSSLSFNLTDVIKLACSYTYGYNENISKIEQMEKRKKIKETKFNFSIQEVFNNVKNIINKIKNETNPQDLIILSCDGVGTFAKTMYTREENYKSKIIKLNDKINVFDPNNINPS